MNRRAFIQSAALLAAGVCRAQQPARPARILDAHTHFFDPSRPQGVPWPPKDDALLHRTTLPDDFRKLAVPQPAAATIAVEASPWLEDNRWLLDLAARAKIITGVVGNLRPGAPDFAANLKRFALDPRFCGIRFRDGSLEKLLAEPVFITDLKLLAESGLTFDVHSPPAWAKQAVRLAERVPDLRLVINHVAGATLDGRNPTDEWRRMIGDLAAQKNIWMKVSGLVEGTGRKDGGAPSAPEIYRPVLDELCSAFGTKRLIFASNWPVCTRFAPTARVQQIALDYFATKGQSALDDVFWNNAHTAYGLKSA